MRHIKSFLLFLSILYFGLARGQTQHLVNSASTIQSFQGGTVEASLGEIAINTISSSEILISQGIHQGAYSFTALNDVEVNLLVDIYPNPATDHFFIKLQEDMALGWMVAIYDQGGKLVMQQSLNSDCSRIELDGFSNQLYILKVFSSKVGRAKSFKIIKNF